MTHYVLRENEMSLPSKRMLPVMTRYVWLFSEKTASLPGMKKSREEFWVGGTILFNFLFNLLKVEENKLALIIIFIIIIITIRNVLLRLCADPTAGGKACRALWSQVVVWWRSSLPSSYDMMIFTTINPMFTIININLIIDWLSGRCQLDISRNPSDCSVHSPHPTGSSSKLGPPSKPALSPLCGLTSSKSSKSPSELHNDY